MSILGTIAIIGGIALVVGGASVAGVYYATEDDRAKARIAQIETEISNCDTIINSFSGLKTKLQNSRNYLSDSKADFTKGGHVLNGVPLADSEFNSCMNKIDSAIYNIDSIISRYNSDKSELSREKRELQSKLD